MKGKWMKNVRKAKIKRKVSQRGINCGDGDLNRRGRRDREEVQKHTE